MKILKIYLYAVSVDSSEEISTEINDKDTNQTSGQSSSESTDISSSEEGGLCSCNKAHRD